MPSSRIIFCVSTLAALMGMGGWIVQATEEAKVWQRCYQTSQEIRALDEARLSEQRRKLDDATETIAELRNEMAQRISASRELREMNDNKLAAAHAQTGELKASFREKLAELEALVAE